MMPRIGIYGGSFSPPHYGHVEAVQSFYSSMMLDKVLVIPTFIAPHKQNLATVSSEHRLAMTRLAFQHLPYVTVSDYEITKKDVSYTAHTLAHFANDGKLFFLCGSDMFLSMDTWYRPDIIFQNAAIVLASRDAALDQACLLKKAIYEDRYSAEIHILENSVRKLSSTEIRAAIRRREDVSGNLPQAVIDYMKAWHLYE
ncbi:MAG: nicotinate (nicotinamide) nucleotide adenylyltransferase [Clostridia bacterium]|nr:nicotinate (nicotinamide) nucleotide adenylyltransferase [Clostridia bacterium]